MNHTQVEANPIKTDVQATQSASENKRVAGVEQLRLKFPGAVDLLFKDVSLSIHQGEKVLFLGPSGCGKSTLLQVLSGLIPHSIEIPLKYKEMTDPESWGYVFQDPDTQFCMPYVDEELAFVLENLQVPRERMPFRIQQLVQQVGLQLNDLHVAISSLSQGMKQRLAIASVLALEPELLFLDEPTALLDPEGTDQVWQTMKEVGQDKTLIIVEHKVDQIIDLVDRVVLFNDKGEIIADDSPTAIFQRYKRELIEFGIWYPGVWDDYLGSRGNSFIHGHLDHKHSDHKNTGSKFESNPDQPLIQLRNFKGYRGKEVKISVSNTMIRPGEWIGIIGENGAGKSTLLLAIMQLIRSSGEYLLHGKGIQEYHSLAEELAFVFQNPEFQFVTHSVFDEIAYTLRLKKSQSDTSSEAIEEDIKMKVTQLMESFSLTVHEEQHPYQLSMGQKRRLSVASAIVSDQPVLLLDEPTFGQDAKNTFAILEKLESWREKGATILMVTHDLNVIRHFATRIWMVEDGQVKEGEPCN